MTLLQGPKGPVLPTLIYIFRTFAHSNVLISGFPNLKLKSDPSPKNIMSPRLTLLHFKVDIYLFSLHFSVLLHLLRHILNLAHPIVLVCLVFLI